MQKNKTSALARRISNSVAKGAYLKGPKHSQGGIKVINKSTGQPLEVEGGEAVITAPAMDDDRPIHEFDGVKGLTKRQVASRVNVLAGGVDFAEKGMRVPKKIKCTGKMYKYGGKLMSDYDIVKDCGCQHKKSKMQPGGKINDSRKTIPLSASIGTNDEPGNSLQYQQYKNVGVMARGGKLPDDSSKVFLEFIKIIKPFIPQFQLTYLTNLWRSEEREAAFEIAGRLSGIIKKLPKTYGTENQETDDKIVYLHYFYAGSDWYIVEKDSEPEQLQAFGYVILDGDMQNAEWGYISIEEIKSIGKVELDFYFEPIAFGELKKKWEGEETGSQKSESGQPARKFKLNDKVRLKPQYLKKEPTMQHFNEATITELSDYYTPETGYMYDTILSQDKSPRHFYESEIEMIQPKSASIPEIAAANPGRIMIVAPGMSGAGKTTQAAKQQATTTASQQAANNNLIRDLVKRKGTDRSKYSAEEIALLRLYEGAGAEKKTSTDARILDQFFTPMDIVAKMWGLAFRHGFTYKNDTAILEPAVGSGRFLSPLPAGYTGYVRAYDVDETAVTICKVLYPKFDIRLKSFETEFFRGRTHIGLSGVTQFFNLVIGNPPYREYVSEYAPLGEKQATGASTFEMYFIARGIDVLVPGGLLIYIIPNTFMSNDSKYNEFKEKLATKADLVDAYRLPNGVFGNTDVGTDIIVLRKK